MTAIGCSLLTLTLLAVVLVLIVGTAFDPREMAEVKAERAGAIFYTDDFSSGSSQLTSTSKNRIDDIATSMRRTSFPIIIEKTDADIDNSLIDERRLEVVQLLEASDAPNAAERTIVAIIQGHGFHLMMTIARTAVFAPLGLFLLLQLLLLIARPSSRKSD